MDDVYTTIFWRFLQNLPPIQIEEKSLCTYVLKSHILPSLRAFKTKTRETCCMTHTMGGSRYLKTCGDAESSWTLNVALLGRQPKVSTLNLCNIVDSEDTVHFKFEGTILSFIFFCYLVIFHSINAFTRDCSI